MGYECVKCAKRILSHSKQLKCCVCRSLTHSTCLNLTTQEYDVLKNDATWTCINCNSVFFPFNSLVDDREFHISLSKFFSDLSDDTIDILTSMVFNPFEMNDSDYVPNTMDTDPDLNFYNELSCKLMSSSNYFTEDHFNSFIKEKQITENNFSMFHHNCRGLSHNSTELFSLLNSILSHSFSVVGLSETHLTESDHNLYSLNGYTILSNYRTERKCGGVSLFVKSKLSFRDRADLNLMKNECETVFIELDKNAVDMPKNVVVGVIYRPPGAPISSFSDHITPILNKIKNENKLCYLLGDFNINLLNSDQHEATSRFIDFMFSHEYIPLINRPTRVTSFSATLIDNIYTNNFEDSLTSHQGIMINNISDHFPVFTILCKNISLLNIAPKLKRKINTRTIDLFHAKLNGVEWSDVLNISDSQAAYTLFLKKYLEVYNHCFPTYIPNNGYKNRKNWLTEGLKTSIKIKNKLYCQCLKHPNQNELKEKCKLYRKQLKSLLQMSEKKHYEDLFNQYRNNARQSWMLIKTIINKNNNSRTCSEYFNINGELTNEPVQIANKFNEYFINVGPSISNSMTGTGNEHKPFL